MGGAEAIGLDVGGTRIRAGRVDAAGRLTAKVVEPVARDRDGFVAQTSRLIAEARTDGTLGVGIGIPGRVDSARGVILSAGHLDVAGLDLPALATQVAGLPATVENDATMALIAEARAAPEAEMQTMLTVGTGIGGALSWRGRPWHGSGVAGQFGHLVVAADGPPCLCGRRGCVETFSSGTAFAAAAAAAGLALGTRPADLLTHADHDPNAAAILDAWARPLRRAVETLVAAVDPARVVIGGGLGAEMVRALARLPAAEGWFGVPVEAAALGDDAGVIGAGLAALQVAS